MAGVFGLDPSLTSTGWAYLGGLGTIVTKPYSDRGKRLADIVNQVMTLVAVAHPDVIVLEGYGFASQALASLAEIRGALLLALDRYWSLPARRLIEVPPATLKKFVTGSGRATKDVMRLEAYKRWGVEHRSHDAIDAYCLLQFGLAVLAVESGDADGLTKFQREAVARFVARPESRKGSRNVEVSG